MKKMTGENFLLRIVLIAAVVLATADLGIAGGEATKDHAKKAKVVESYGKLPLYFIQNNGQENEKVNFYERGSGRATYFTQEGLYLSLVRREKKDEIKEHENFIDKTMQSETIKLAFVNANPSPEIVPQERQEGRVNYLIGNDPGKWRTNIPTFAKVRYQEVYPNIDIRFYGNNKQLEYDVVVKPGGTPSGVKFAYKGIKGLNVNREGNLEIILKNGKMVQKKPLIYQEIGGQRVERAGSFMLLGGEGDEHLYAFEVSFYDKTHTLVIDPVLSYSTFLGGGGGDQGGSIAVDLSGNAYVAGYTGSTNFPTQNPIYGYADNYDAFVTKINTSGNALVYSTYLGGNDYDRAIDIAVDASGNAYVTGETWSPDFPTQNPIQGSYGSGSDAFVSKINASGNALVYSTYLGGDVADLGSGIAVDTSGNAYVTGSTMSGNFPTQNPIQVTHGGGSNDVFVTKINAGGTALIYSTYLGGSGSDIGSDIAVDTSGNAYVAGYTMSTNFPTQNPIQATNAGDHDVFVTKINPGGTALVYSSYLGGSSNYGDYGLGIAVDTSGNTYITGYTSSTDFPIQDPIQGTNAGWNDVFVTKINAGGTVLVYSTYLGGICGDEGHGIAVDSSGNAYVTGRTCSTEFPMKNPIQGTHGGGTYDAFVTKIADIAQSQYTLNVTKEGTGTGTVTSNPAGIDCGNDCEEAYGQGTAVTLTATPDTGSVFGGWSGDCDSNGQVTMDANKTCIAHFTSSATSAAVPTMTEWGMILIVILLGLSALYFMKRRRGITGP